MEIKTKSDESNQNKNFNIQFNINSSSSINNDSNINNQNDEEAAPIMPLNNIQINYINNIPIKKEENENNYYVNNDENEFIPLNIYLDEVTNNKPDNNNNINNDQNNKQPLNNRQNESNYKNYNAKKEKMFTNNQEINKEGNNDSIISENKNYLNNFNYNDLLELKKKTFQKYEQGYLPLFLRMYNQKPAFYFVKFENNLKSLLKTHLKLNGYNPEDKYTLINKGKILDQNCPIEDLDIKVLSIINIIKD